MEEEMALMGSLFHSWEGFFCCCFVGVFSPNKVFVALWCVLMAFVFFVLADWKIDQCVVPDRSSNEQECILLS